jgi:hypothetical protein
VADEDAAGNEPHATALGEWWFRCADRWQGWLEAWPGWIGYWQRQREMSRPVVAHLNPARIPVRDFPPDADSTRQ